MLEHQLNLSKRLFNIPAAVLDDIFGQIYEMKKMYPNWFKAGKKMLGRELEKQKKKEKEK